MTIIKTLVCAVVAASALISPAVAQPDIAANEVRREVNKNINRSLTLSPDGRYLVIVQTNVWYRTQEVQFDSAGSQVQLWEVASARLLWTKQVPANHMSRFNFSADSSRLLCEGRYDRVVNNVYVEHKNHVRLWTVPEGKELLAKVLREDGEINELVLSPDGQQMIGKEFDIVFARFKRWDANTGNLLGSLLDIPELKDTGDWETTGGHMLSQTTQVRRGAGVKNKLHVWSLPGLNLLHSIETGPAMVQHKALSADGKLLAYLLRDSPSGGQQNQPVKPRVVYLKNLQTNKTLDLATPANASHYNFDSLEFTRDGQTLIGSGATWQEPRMVAVVCLWNAQSGALIRTFKPGLSFGEGENIAYRIHLLPDGKSYLTVNKAGKIEQRSLEDGALIRNFEVNE